MISSTGKICVLASFCILLGFGCSKAPAANNKPVTIPTQRIGDIALAEKMSQSQPAKDEKATELHGVDRGILMIKADYQYQSFLDDVTGGGATGLARASFDNNTYQFYASFSDLLPPPADHFYEGWLVRKEPFHFIRVGRIEELGGIYTNLYQSGTDWRDHTYFVVTLQKNDGNAAPATHIIEGELGM